MDKLNKVFSELISGKISIVIYVVLFVYLVLVPLIALLPNMEWLMPSTAIMLVGDNYTSVLAALGASIAAGSGIAIHKHIKTLHKKHKDLEDSINELHKKIDSLKKD
ncbi:MAG: hypothetical protein LBQ02_04080 [Candidatus Nomurabacteria bacterium]|jgi:hypothetical protein|nr:hypothetical protein [Candidatus Nomurabacteria bacterium]